MISAPSSRKASHLQARLQNTRAPSMRFLTSLLLLLFLFRVETNAQAPSNPQPYYPGNWDEWEMMSPETAGFNASKLQEAIDYAISMESNNPRNMEINHYGTFGREPFGDGIGPFKSRGEMTGIIIKNGYIVAEWGEPFRVDMTHSVTKSFLSSTVGLAWDAGLIRDIHDPVGPYMAPILLLDEVYNRDKGAEVGEPHVVEPFQSEHNQKITWDHLLRQTSDWEGTLFGKPDWADRPSGDRAEWQTRERNEPGTSWEYNDVRVNVLALAALNVWRKPLPQILKEQLMDKIGASPTWRWHGYENSWVLIDGVAMQSVSGGGHWGGGMFISARDQARFGLLTLRNGQWKDVQILSKEWITMATSPTSVRENYGFMNYFLNPGQEAMPAAPESAFWHLGAGNNMVYVDQENDLVIVARWIQGEGMNGLVERVLAALE